MAFDILDACAFYAGVPFKSDETYYTTPLIYDEIRHIKKDHDALGILVETGRLCIVEPHVESVKRARAAAAGTGDAGQISRQDISVVALALERSVGIITDDYAIANVAGRLHIPVLPIMTSGIRTVGRWMHYCPGCGTGQKTGRYCNTCGTRLKKRLVSR